MSASLLLMSRLCVAGPTMTASTSLFSRQQRFVNHKPSKNWSLRKKPGKRKDKTNAHFYPAPDNPARVFWVDWVEVPGTDTLYTLPTELEEKVKRLTKSKRLVIEQASDRFRKPKSTDNQTKALPELVASS